VVVGLDCPTGLQTARIFAERGIEVIGMAADLRHPCVRTRRVRRVVHAERDPDDVVRALGKLARDVGRPAVLVPCTDLAVLGIARHREELEPDYLFSIPPAAVIERLLDKARFAELARTHDLPVPETRIVRGRADLFAASTATGFPCVLKPAVKSARWDVEVPAKAFILSTYRDLLQVHGRYGHYADTFVLQEWIHGTDSDHYTCDGYLARDGRPLVTFTSRKLRQWPPVVGQACLSVEHEDDRVRDLALRTLRAAGHHGQGYVEIKWDARRGRHVVIEANVGRPTGRSATAERAGVELLMTLYNDLVGRPLPAERVQRFRGTRWIHLRRDLQACAKLMAEGKLTVGGMLRSWRGPFACALWSATDPVPFLADMLGAAWNVLRGRTSINRARAGARPDEPPRLTPLPVAALVASEPEENGTGHPAPQPEREHTDPLVTLTVVAGVLAAHLAELLASLPPVTG